MSEVKVKICGITTENDIHTLNCELPDYAGFVFFEKSKRNITMEKAKTLLSMLDPNIKPVAVCVSPNYDLLWGLRELGFQIIQVHGSLTEDIIDAWNGEIWQAVNLEGTKIPHVIYNHKITGYVVDGANYGGGEPFEWENPELIQAFKFLKNDGELLILAGGLNPHNVEEGIRIFQPDVVDVSSGVEGEKEKNPEAVASFIRTARMTNNNL